MTNRGLATFLMCTIGVSGACSERSTHPTEDGAPSTYEVVLLPREINLDRIHVASVFLLSEPGFDATSVRGEGVTLLVGQGGQVPVAFARGGSGAYWTRDVDYDHDGDMDRIFAFSVTDMTTEGLTEGRPALTLIYQVGAQTFKSPLPTPLVFRGPRIHR